MIRFLCALWLAGCAWQAQAATILVFGDSLSAGYGIRQEAAWPALLEQRLHEKRLDYSVVNASISGETSAGGRARLAEALHKHHPKVLILALGANDGLRGLPLPTLQGNLLAMTDIARKNKAKVLLVGMRLPPNYGAYASAFAEVFAHVADSRQLAFAPFLLDGIAARRELFQADGLHPLAEAQTQLLDNVWPPLLPLLK
jgi:acyl-CoA thioesterase-1